MASPVESTHSAPEAPGADDSSSSIARSAMMARDQIESLEK
jgi:hypothetical protein